MSTRQDEDSSQIISKSSQQPQHRLSQFLAHLTNEWEKWRNVENFAAMSATLAVACVALMLGLSFFCLVLIAFSTICGFILCDALLNRDNVCVSIRRFLDERLFSRHADSNNNNNTSAGGGGSAVGNKLSSRYRTPPWTSLRVGRRVNDVLEDFFETLIETYIHNWYKAEISVDNTFLLEIRYQIRHASAVILAKLGNTDFVNVFFDDLLPTIVAHLERVGRLASSQDAKFSNIPSSALEMRILSQLPGDLHWAMSARENERDYLRVLADALVAGCVDAAQIGGRAIDGEAMPLRGNINNLRSWWPSLSCRHFLREMVLYAILLPTMDFFADPDTLNRLILTALSDASDEIDDDDEEKNVEFLRHLTDLGRSHAPDSLLSLKLNDLVREPRLIQLFDMYLRDINGPMHLLDCFLQARDIHKRIQCFRSDSSNNNNNGGSDHGQKREMTLAEIESDAWQLFSAFVHESAPNRIEFSAAVCSEFSAAIDGTKNLALLEKATEDIYKQIYQRLHFDYVIPFCQSESYLGYLCGAPPDVEELIRRPGANSDNDDAGVLRGASGRAGDGVYSFSLSQFRNKLFSVIGGGGGMKSSSSRDSPLELLKNSTEDGSLLLGPGAKFQNNTDDFETGEIALIDLGRDLNKWTITVPAVESRRELVSSKMYFVYVIEVKRNDLTARNESPDCADSIRAGKLMAAREKTKSLPSRSATSFQSFVGGFDDGAEALQLLSADARTNNCESANGMGSAESEELLCFNGSDSGEMLPTTWTTSRKYDEFFLLEEKIREFHGNSLRAANLPDRKTFLTTRNRSLMEAHRPLFERFLQTLAQQSILRRSDLLYDFLTLSEDDWIADVERAGTNFFMPDLRNPLRAMRRMPTKLARERGQNLKPFILNMLANILVPRSAIYSTTNTTDAIVNGHVGNSKSKSSKNSASNTSLLHSSTQSVGSLERNSSPLLCPSEELEFGSISSVGSSCAKCLERAKQQQKIPHTFSAYVGKNDSSKKFVGQSSRIALDNLSIQIQAENRSGGAENESYDTHCDCLSSEKFLGKEDRADFHYSTLEKYLQSAGFASILTFTLLKVVRVSRWFEALFVAICRFFEPLIDRIFRGILQRFVNKTILREQTVVSAVQSLHKVVFDIYTNSSSTTASDEERRLRADLALHCLDEAIASKMPAVAPLLARIFCFDAQNGDMRAVLRRIFISFQLPRLNKQLVFVLIDKMSRRFLPDFLNEEEEEDQ